MVAGSRRSTRISSSQQSQNSSPSTSQSSPGPAGKKRKAEAGSSPSAKRGKKDDKAQQTIEETMDLDKKEPTDDQSSGPNVEKREDSEASKRQSENSKAVPEGQQSTYETADDATQNGKSETKSTETNDHAQESLDDSEKKEVAQDPKSTETKDTSSTNDKAVKPHARDGDVPSSILEKGIMYFLYRGRVNIDSPDSVSDIQRSFLILRPLPHGAKLGDGPISTTSKDCRLIAIPKKTLPTSGNDKWTGFVEKSKTSFPELKESFLKEDHYETQTQGTQKTPATSPAAEGVYAITTTGRDTHLAYIVTLPTELGEVQHDLGVRQKGSFILSTKNPKAPGPSSADLGTDPGFSDEIMKEFRSLRWMPTKPEHLDYEYCQFLMIGEGEEGLEKATEPQDKDVKNDKSAPLEEMEKLGEEDEIRVKHLNNEDAVYKDLGMDSESYPGLQTTW